MDTIMVSEHDYLVTLERLAMAWPSAHGPGPEHALCHSYAEPMPRAMALGVAVAYARMVARPEVPSGETPDALTFDGPGAVVPCERAVGYVIPGLSEPDICPECFGEAGEDGHCGTCRNGVKGRVGQ